MPMVAHELRTPLNTPFLETRMRSGPSTPGEGSAFNLTLPRAALSLPE